MNANKIVDLKDLETFRGKFLSELEYALEQAVEQIQEDIEKDNEVRKSEINGMISDNTEMLQGAIQSVIDNDLKNTEI